MPTIIVAPGIKDTDLSQPPTFDQKVRVFHSRMRGWKLDIADAMINGYKARDGSYIHGIPEAGFAALDVMFNYFESVGKYYVGFTGEGEAGKHFKIGLHFVFPNIAQHGDAQGIKFVEDTLWTAVRCGIYHAGMTKGNVFITGDIANPIEIPADYKAIAINPHILVKALLAHVDGVRSELLALGEASPRGQCFVARYDHDNK